MTDLVVDWKSLLSSLQIQWVDTGSNTSPGNINIKCPFCVDDPSFHLSISLSGAGYYCYRNPRHGGKSGVYLLRGLGYGRDAGDLLDRYTTVTPDLARAPAAQRYHSNSAMQIWQRFHPAYESDDCLDYLAKRGFPSPRQVCKDYDLRYAPYGEWARRLLFPLSDERGVVSFTGRDIDNRELRYRNAADADAGLVYLPRSFIGRHLLLVEGPVDALKISVATDPSIVTPMALTGLALNADRLMTIRYYARQTDHLLMAIDSSVLQNQWRHIKNALDSVCKPLYTLRFPVPAEWKDPGEMPITAIAQWLWGLHETSSAG